MSKQIQSSTHTFSDIIESNFLYVDKTRHIYELVRYGKGAYFLARPRRFGKSLLISTLSEIFQGNKELFKGLWIYDSDYQWQTYPVLRFDFSRHAVSTAEELKQLIDYYVAEIAEAHEITLRGFDYQTRFDNLIQQLGKTKQVVLLIDEYDKPIIDNLENLPEAKKIRTVLKNFYTIVKALDPQLRFVFITGISKFSKVGIFSAMNNLDDLTMSPRFDTMLGITDEELRRDFTEHLEIIADQQQVEPAYLWQQIKKWYNGYCFVGDGTSVYNPYSTLQFFSNGRFSNYWFETGTPTFLIKLIKEREYDLEPLDNVELPEMAFSTYAIESLHLIPLLFQTGYLTIKDFWHDEFGEMYTLSYPNYEVKNAFLFHLLTAYNDVEFTLSESHLRQLLYALNAQDLPKFFSVLEVFFANIDYDLQLNYEKYYQAIFYIIFMLLGVRITAEVKTNNGRIDTVIEMREHIFIFEFKIDGTAVSALNQIKTHEYTKKYQLKGKPITLIGANFDSNTRQISEWEHEHEQ